MATIEDIARQLNSLKEQLGQHGSKADEILAELKKLQPEQFQAYSEAFQTGLPYMTQGVIDAIAAGRSGDPLAISIASLSIFSGFLTVAGPMTGPVGPLISALTGLLQAILGQFLPVGPSLKDEITEVFEKFLAEQKLSDLGTAADQIWVFVDTLEHGHTGKPQPTAWTPLDLNSGPQITAIDNAWQWLANTDKQSLPQWATVLEKTCRIFTQMLRAVTVSVAYPSTRPNARPGEMLVYLPSRMRKFLEYLRKITPVARQRGTFWHIGANYLYSYHEWGAVYTCDSIVKDPKWVNLGGNSRVMTVTLNEGQEGQPRPVVTLLTLEPVPGYSEDPKSNDPFRPNKRTYGVRGESPPDSSWHQLMSNDSSHPLEGCYDICALPADERYPEGIFFYTANGNEIRGYVQDKAGKVSWAWSYPVASDHKVGSIRMVRPRGFSDDPDENPKGNPGVLKDIVWVQYGGCRVSGNWLDTDILVRFADAKEVLNEGYVRAPWGDLRGIGVDQGYLWVYRGGHIACATHTSIRKALKENRAPSWMVYEGFPKSVVEKLYDEKRYPHWLSGLVDLSPCDDGTLFAAFNEGTWKIGSPGLASLKLFMLTPRIDRQKRTLALQAADFVRIRGAGFRVRKQPLFCWSLLEELTATLEEQTAVPPQSLRTTSMLDDVAAKLQRAAGAIDVSPQIL